MDRNIPWSKQWMWLQQTAKMQNNLHKCNDPKNFFQKTLVYSAIFIHLCKNNIIWFFQLQLCYMKLLHLIIHYFKDAKKQQNILFSVQNCDSDPSSMSKQIWTPRMTLVVKEQPSLSETIENSWGVATVKPWIVIWAKSGPFHMFSHYYFLHY